MIKDMNITPAQEVMPAKRVEYSLMELYLLPQFIVSA